MIESKTEETHAKQLPEKYSQKQTNLEKKNQRWWSIDSDSYETGWIDDKQTELFFYLQEKNWTACSWQTHRPAVDLGKTIGLNKDKHRIICYKSNQSSEPTQMRDLDPHRNKADIRKHAAKSACLHMALFVLCSWTGQPIDT